MPPPAREPRARPHDVQRLAELLQHRCSDLHLGGILYDRPLSGAPRGWVGGLVTTRSGGRLRVLQLADAEGGHDVPHTMDDRECGHPGDQKNSAAPVVARRPEAERELDDPADELQPPDLDLVPRGDRHDDVEGSREDEEEAEDGGERAGLDTPVADRSRLDVIAAISGG